MSGLLTEDQKRLLLDTARRAIASHLESGASDDVRLEDARLREERGVFVSLKVGGELRGCIGFPWPHRPLDRAVQEAAVSAATQDYRFSSLKRSELNRTTIEISVLSLPAPIADPKEISVGTHGIIVSKGERRGLLLPQVPVEWGWGLDTFLENACLKAGLAKDAWKGDIRIEKFTAQVFSDNPSHRS